MKTTRARWHRIQQLCEALEGVPAHDYASRLHSLETDDTLRVDVLSLLQAVEEEQQWGRVSPVENSGDRLGSDRRAGSDLELQRSDPSRDVNLREFSTGETRPLTPVPDHIGPYRIVTSLGAGGSGEVFRAIRTINGIEHAVALKRFHAQRSSPEHLERFAREQRMLAALTHPDIVRFIDAGLTDDGRPYLVMDLAEGEPITEYCERLALKLPERLRLIREVCEAVQAAHARLIVHLDLKPSNILVADGRVKLLDFGTAKLVDPDAAVTRTQSLTLLYASPEQLRGDPVSVACDVYSIGLILYELASGQWPFRRPETIMTLAERAAGHHEPKPLPPHLSRDVDAICRKAIAHDPAQRYASVADFAEDLRRFQIGDPVHARGLSVGYRLRKLARRHAWKVAAAVTLVVGLSAAAIYSAVQARSARQSASRSEAANDFLSSMFTLTGRDAASRTTMTVRELLALAESRVTATFGGDPDHQRVASEIETSIAYALLWQDAFPESERLFGRAIDRAKAVGDIPREAIARAGRGYVYYLESRTDDAWRESQAALDLWSRHRAEFTPPQAVTALANGARTLSYLRPTDLIYRPYYEACVELSARFADSVRSTLRAGCLVGLATSYTIIDSRYAEAEPLLKDAIAIQRADPVGAGALATSLQMHGMVNRYLGRFDEDERAQRESHEINARDMGAESMAATWQRAVWALSLLGVARNDDAYRESQAIMTVARRIVPKRGGYLLWTPLFTATATACVVGRYDECEAHAREAIETLGSATVTDPRLASARGFLGVAMVHTGRCAEGKPLVLDAIRANETRRRTPPYAGLLNDAAQCRPGL